MPPADKTLITGVAASAAAPSSTNSTAVGADAESSAHFANRAAGIVVSKMGTAVPTPAELLGN